MELKEVLYASNMENLANIYVAIHNPEHEKWNKYNDSVRRSIEVLNPPPAFVSSRMHPPLSFIAPVCSITASMLQPHSVK
jgi:hypothetical protein